MPWAYIAELLGPGLHWGRSQQELNTAIQRARADGQHEAAEHLEIILGLRNVVMMEEKAPARDRTGAETNARPSGENGSVP